MDMKIAFAKFFSGLTISSAVCVIIQNPSYKKKVMAILNRILSDEGYNAGATNSGFI